MTVRRSSENPPPSDAKCVSEPGRSAVGSSAGTVVVRDHLTRPDRVAAASLASVSRARATDGIIGIDRRFEQRFGRGRYGRIQGGRQFRAEPDAQSTPFRLHDAGVLDLFRRDPAERLGGSPEFDLDLPPLGRGVGGEGEEVRQVRAFQPRRFEPTGGHQHFRGRLRPVRQRQDQPVMSRPAAAGGVRGGLGGRHGGPHLPPRQPQVHQTRDQPQQREAHPRDAHHRPHVPPVGVEEAGGGRRGTASGGRRGDPTPPRRTAAGRAGRSPSTAAGPVRRSPP